MTKIVTRTFLLSIIVLMSGFISSEKTTLKVEVTNFENKVSTKVLVGIFSQKDFLEKPIQEKSRIAEGNKVIVEFDLPEGEYAVFASQDVNNNGKLDKNFFGKPQEPYGFSNNVNPFGTPSNKDCKFPLSNSAKTISIKLIN